MSIRWDIAVYDQQNRLTLAIEVKTRIHASPEWAAQMLRNLLAHGTLPYPQYFLMTFPDVFYLWVLNNQYLDIQNPNYTIDAESILKPFFERLDVDPYAISGESLEIMVRSWLNQVMHGDLSPEELSQPWLHESGLYSAIAGRIMLYEVLV